MPASHRIRHSWFVEVTILWIILIIAVSGWGQTPAAPKDSGPIPYPKLSAPRRILPTAQSVLGAQRVSSHDERAGI